MQKATRKLFAICLLIGGAGNVRADELHQFFQNLNTLNGEFTQRVDAAALKAPKVTHGRFAISRPGKFRWEYQKPYQQLLVSDGKTIWIYDADLEQVTRRKWDAAVSDTPAQLLAGNEPLEKGFHVKNPTDGQSESVYELTPKKSDTGFNSIKLLFVQHELKKMILQDGLGQITTLEFSRLQRNGAVDGKQFNFTPPKGVDVLESN